jgi:hypothetical protein
MRRFFLLVPLFLGGVTLAACGGRTPLSQRGDGGVVACATEAPLCVTTGEDPCGVARQAAVCDNSTKTWSCPSGAINRAPNPTGLCRPFHDGTLTSLSGSIVRVPTNDGRCYWIGEDAIKSGGTHLRNVAFDMTDDALKGSCPQKPGIVGEVVQLDEPNPQSFLVQLLGGTRFAGDVRVVYRLFKVDPNAPFGALELGGGFAHWDSKNEKILVPAASKLRWGPDLSLGDATMAKDGFLYVWGCPPPIEFLTEKCLMARFDASEQMELLQVDTTWSKGTAQASAARLFDAGPWLGSVVPRPGGFLHAYVVGFGSDIQAHASTALEGPWSQTTNLHHCDLPAGDPKAFCAGPVVHEEMANPAAPSGLVITYGVGTTAPNAAQLQATRPDDYWPRLVWVTTP